MTSEQRMILRRHHAAYRELGPADAALRAAIRIGLAIGMTQGETARQLSVSRKTVWSVVNGHRSSLTALQGARESIARAERALSIARGRERAAIEKASRYGYPIPESLMQGRGLADAPAK